MPRKSCLIAVLLFVLASLSPFSPARAELQKNVLFILDGSGSMWGETEGGRKIEVAKELLASLIAQLPPDIHVGLMSYGHRREKDCRDVELLVPISPLDPATLKKQIDSIQPRGKTPLTGALWECLPALVDHLGDDNTVVLISDGEETCGGAPCDTVSQLVKGGMDIQVHVVGFDVNAKQRSQLECIASNGDGRYFQADNAAGLEQALANVQAEVTGKEPVQSATPRVVFIEEFDGPALAEHWEVINHDTGFFLQEKGTLLNIIRPGEVTNDSLTNLFLLDWTLPKGDWRATLKLHPNIQRRNSRIFLFLYQDAHNLVGSSVGQKNLFRWVRAEKVQAGEPTAEGRDYYKNEGDFLDNDVWLRLEKRGRRYSTSFSTDGETFTFVGGMTMLRINGRLAIGGHIWGDDSGETSVKFDALTVESLSGS